MSYTLADLFTRVQNKLDDPSFDTGVLTQFANDTEREVFNRYRINTEEQQNDTITTTAGSRALTGLPGIAGSQAVGVYINLRIILPVNYSRLIPYVEYEDADKYYPNYQLLGQGTPIAWFIFDGVPTLLNNADKTYTLSAKYTINPTPLENPTDVPNIPEEYSEITILGMYARALEFNDEYDEAQAVRQQFNRLCIDYVDATRRTAGTPHVLRRPRTVNGPIGLR
jgi:hypothetical protein